MLKSEFSIKAYSWFDFQTTISVLSPFCYANWFNSRNFVAITGSETLCRDLISITNSMKENNNRNRSRSVARLLKSTICGRRVVSHDRRHKGCMNIIWILFHRYMDLAVSAWTHRPLKHVARLQASQTQLGKKVRFAVERISYEFACLDIKWTRVLNFALSDYSRDSRKDIIVYSLPPDFTILSASRSIS